MEKFLFTEEDGKFMGTKLLTILGSIFKQFFVFENSVYEIEFSYEEIQDESTFLKFCDGFFDKYIYKDVEKFSGFETYRGEKGEDFAYKLIVHNPNNKIKYYPFYVTGEACQKKTIAFNLKKYSKHKCELLHSFV